MDFTTTDPFTQVLNRLWALLEADTTFCATVLPGNRIKFTTDIQGNPIKENVQAGDLPEVIIEPTSCADQFAKTSAAGTSDCVHRIFVATGDMHIATANVMHWMLWRIFQAASDRLVNVPAGLLDLGFIWKNRFSVVTSATLDPLISRGRKGWCVILTCTTTLELPKAI